MSTLPVRKSGVALSGGGHRATLFALGALMYLVDAKVNVDVNSIASVSGGSLTNGFVGQAVNFRETDSTEFRNSVAKPLARQIANEGTLFAPFFAKVYVVFLVLSAVASLVIPAVPPVAWYWRIVIFLGCITLWSFIFGARGRVCARAFAAKLYSPSGRETELRDLKKANLDHVLCSTEFRSAEQVYFSGEFVYSFALGHGEPGHLSLAKAVQSSAAFPGGFPPAILPTKEHKFTGAPTPEQGGPPAPPTKMVLTDGGVYDNMGEQWARGYVERVKRCPNLGSNAPNQLVVVNASARVPWVPFHSRLIPLIGELAALLRVNDVMYINTTNVRRQAIVDSFNPVDPTKAAALPSVLVQIAQSPFRVATSFAKDQGDVGERAREVVNFLSAGPNQDAWSKIASANSKVGTSLNRFGKDVTARLIYQGYVVTMCNLRVLFGTSFPLFEEQLNVESFSALLES